MRGLVSLSHPKWDRIGESVLTSLTQLSSCFSCEIDILVYTCNSASKLSEKGMGVKEYNCHKNVSWLVQRQQSVLDKWGPQQLYIEPSSLCWIRVFSKEISTRELLVWLSESWSSTPNSLFWGSGPQTNILDPRLMSASACSKSWIKWKRGSHWLVEFNFLLYAHPDLMQISRVW